MNFIIEHKIFRDHFEKFSSDSPPWWLISKEYKWWWGNYVLTLEIGEYVETAFRKITRIP